MSAKTLLQSWYSDDTPLIFGHRGASADAPMNTIPAFELAAEQGADGVELDVHLTRDNDLIIVHDFTIDHTTDGTGTVTEMSLAELKALDAGGWFDKQFAGTRLPTLDEVFEAVGDVLYINVEIKTLSEEGDGTEEAVAACIAKHQMGQRVLVSSFNPHVLKRFRAIAPEIPLGYLLHPMSLQQPAYGLLQPSDYEALHYHHEMITPEYLAAAASHNQPINTWTVNEVETAQRLVAQGVQGIMTDKPDIMHEALR